MVSNGIDWKSIKLAINQTMLACSGLRAGDIRWDDEPQSSQWESATVVKLSVQTMGEIGIDEQSLTLPLNTQGLPDTTKNAITATDGMRDFVLRVRVESNDGRIDSPNWSGAVMSRIFARLQRPEMIELRSGIFAIATRTKLQRVQYVKDNRQLSVFVRDLMCLTYSHDVDQAPGSGSWIEQSSAQSDYAELAQDSEGDDVQSPKQINVTVNAGA